jgi:dUTP pyrophosphatase
MNKLHYSFVSLAVFLYSFQTLAQSVVERDYRGEAGVVIENRSYDNFDLRHGMRIAQIIFQTALIPDIESVESPDLLLETRRGSGGFGSTGLR